MHGQQSLFPFVLRLWIVKFTAGYFIDFMNLLSKNSNQLDGSMNEASTIRNDPHPPVRLINSVIETSNRIATTRLRVKRAIEKNKKSSQRMTGLELRIDVLLDEVERLKKKWKVDQQ